MEPSYAGILESDPSILLLFQLYVGMPLLEVVIEVQEWKIPCKSGTVIHIIFCAFGILVQSQMNNFYYPKGFCIHTQIYETMTLIKSRLFKAAVIRAIICSD